MGNVEINSSARKAGVVVSTEGESRFLRARATRAASSREIAIIAVAILLVIVSSWGFYTKSMDVNTLQPVVGDLEEQLDSYSSKISELNALLAQLEEQIAHDEQEYKETTNVLRQEIEALKKRLYGTGLGNTSLPQSTLPGKTAYLTFDDGPLAATAQILDILKEHDVKATFFVNGRDSDYALRMYKRMANEGHAIGNHSYSHEYNKVYKSIGAFVNEVEQLQDLIYQTTGKTPEVLRFPGGSDTRVSVIHSGRDLMPTLTKIVQVMGLQYFDWNVTSASASVSATAESIYNSVIDGCQGKNTVNILFHETRLVAEALPAIIEELKEQGYVFATLTRNSPVVQFLR